jgi:hypothetical protein
MLISFRMPEAWRGKVNDQKLLTWLREYAVRRPALPADPGPSRFKRSFRLPDSEQQLMGSVAEGDVSSFLRRLIAFRLTFQEQVPSGSPRQQPPALASPLPKEINPVSEQHRPTPRRPQSVDVAFSRVEDRSVPLHRPPTDLPAILCQPCEANRFSPMWRNGEWTRTAVTAEEQHAYQELMEARQREQQRRKHAWEMSVGAICTCVTK